MKVIEVFNIMPEKTSKLFLVVRMFRKIGLFYRYIVLTFHCQLLNMYFEKKQYHRGLIISANSVK